LEKLFLGESPFPAEDLDTFFIAFAVFALVVAGIACAIIFVAIWGAARKNKK